MELQELADDVAGIVQATLRKERSINVYWCYARIVGSSMHFDTGSYNTGVTITVEAPGDLASSRTERMKMAERIAKDVCAQYKSAMNDWIGGLGLQSVHARQ